MFTYWQIYNLKFNSKFKKNSILILLTIPSSYTETCPIFTLPMFSTTKHIEIPDKSFVFIFHNNILMNNKLRTLLTACHRFVDYKDFQSILQNIDILTQYKFHWVHNLYRKVLKLQTNIVKCYQKNGKWTFRLTSNLLSSHNGCNHPGSHTHSLVSNEKVPCAEQSGRHWRASLSGSLQSAPRQPFLHIQVPTRHKKYASISVFVEFDKKCIIYTAIYQIDRIHVQSRLDGHNQLQVQNRSILSVLVTNQL